MTTPRARLTIAAQAVRRARDTRSPDLERLVAELHAARSDYLRWCRSAPSWEAEAALAAQTDFVEFVEHSLWTKAVGQDVEEGIQ